VIVSGKYFVDFITALILDKKKERKIERKKVQFLPERGNEILEMLNGGEMSMSQEKDQRYFSSITLPNVGRV